MSADLRLVDGDLPYPLSWISGDYATAQRIQVRLGIWKGEPLFDSEAGVPWIEWLNPESGIRPDVDVICSILQQQVVDCPGVKSASCTGTITRGNLAVEIQAQLGDSTLTIQVGVGTEARGNPGGTWLRTVTHRWH